ncbi:unnamed protein product [Callosobruchus maculatus]|uniref:Uncharacterized protein n=1 Tax=Callosobruchus maculatus TaxID=64391 RepID=A0A653BYZ9_CALMS|nr:unnamed protein product [Callosobruchus maculatus]
MSKTASKKEENEMLIELVKNYRLLYDPNDVNFTNRIERHRCWEKISENVDMAVPECKKRWRSLRDQYNKKRREYGLASSTNWKYETQMSFLLEFMTDRRSENWKRSLGFIGNHRYADLTPEQCHSRIRICRIHFSAESFSDISKTRLTTNVVPSLLLPAETGFGNAAIASTSKQFLDSQVQTESTLYIGKVPQICRYHHLYTMSCKTRRSRRIHGKMTETNILIKICKWQNPKIGELNRQRPGGQEKTYDL